MHDVATIAAISTPPGTGAIGVVRVSGPATLAIAQRVFVRSNGKPPSSLESHRVYHGFVVAICGERVDEVLLCVMRQPHSYTREDVIEISCHGGVVTTQRVLDAVLACGARVAEPGEFTKRAFLNGRLDLTQAEAVIDLIQAHTAASHRVALNQLEGALSRHLRGLREELLQVSIYLEAGIDFPEEDIELVSEGGLIDRLAASAANLTCLLGTFEHGRVMREGLATAIVGRPNVGKSSLLNALTGRDRAIVSPHPGTTRDTIEAALDLQGLLLRVIDTAGIRMTTEAIEQEGVRRARKVVEEAELLVVVLDRSNKLTTDDHALLADTAGKLRILVRNKRDMPAQWSLEALGSEAAGSPMVEVSALQGDGLPELERAIIQQALGRELPAGGEVLLTRARHHQSLVAARQNVRAAEQGLRQGIPVEFIAFDVTEALRHIGEVLGEDYSGEVLDRIFSQFCIGK
ncbi:tRNA modification GTPase MnmE [Candidatus Entotheonellaceae bacterium PAL068K]